MNISKEYQYFCEEKGILFKLDDKVNPYNDSTLFCPAGMQQFKDKFKDISHKETIANIQSCIRMNDFQEIGDGTHLLYFNMIGLFSFNEMTIEQAINFWVEFIQDKLKTKIDYVTIHPDKIKDWSRYYKDIEIKEDIECIWSDGEIGGYCTEFYKDGVEIGNIVNPLDRCIDVGFGLERLDLVINGKEKTKNEILKETILKLIDSGYKPSALRQGYVLRKLLRELCLSNDYLDHPFFINEVERQKGIVEKYNRLKTRFKDKSNEWWLGTHGIDLTLI